MVALQSLSRVFKEQNWHVASSLQLEESVEAVSFVDGTKAFVGFRDRPSSQRITKEVEPLQEAALSQIAALEGKKC